MSEQENDSVKVALRIRPLVESEIERGCNSIIDVIPSLQQIHIAEKAFTFNYVFDSGSSQEELYSNCAKNMICNLFKGYNVTMLAYGQTGSGKTYTMGTSYNGLGEMGIIPRAINDIFNHVHDNFSYDFTINVTFMELYQETLYDLLSKKPKDQCSVEIREDGKNIIIPNLTEEPVDSASKALHFLKLGSSFRAIGSTNMNAQSSRSHAIFTINICMQKKDDSNQNKTAKFHLVDLAGSERSKKTGATGQTFKEGVNINKGLLALGNVISALGDDKLQGGYISYRDSNLTRLLKDSLGGNSITLMIACVSPADYNLEETLSTLRYADRAKKIKNTPVINQDPKIAEINRLKKTIQQLRLELVGQGGPIVCQAEINTIKKENDTMRRKIRELTIQVSSSINEKTALLEGLCTLQLSNERLRNKLVEIKNLYDLTLHNLNTSLEEKDENRIKESIAKLKSLKEQLDELDSEHMKTEEEVRVHEANARAAHQFHLPIITMSGGGGSGVDDNNSKDDLSKDAQVEKEMQEQHENYAANQMAKDEKLQEILKMLAIKENLAQQIASNNHCYMVDYQVISETEEKLTNLERERDELLLQLNTNHHKKNTGGNSNQVKGAAAAVDVDARKKRFQQLENKIQDLRRKVVEQARLIKLKEKDEVKIKQLQKEIQSMKHMKVKLIREMKQEADKFRQWKRQRELEVCKLKEQDRKRQNQMKVMETINSRKQNVLKRKVEEVAAINKRLKDALALRNKVAQEQKSLGKIEQTGAWLQQELNVFLSVVEAKATLPSLLDDRATLVQQMESLKENGKEEDDSEEIMQLKIEMELRSMQIQELQQKLLDSDEENKSKSRFENIQTMTEAKYCLKMLFQITSEIKKNEMNTEMKMQELLQNQNEVMETLKKLEIQLSVNDQNHQLELAAIQKEYEEKISVLLRQSTHDVDVVEQEVNYKRNVHFTSTDDDCKDNDDDDDFMVSRLHIPSIRTKNDTDLRQTSSFDDRQKYPAAAAADVENDNKRGNNRNDESNVKTASPFKTKLLLLQDQVEDVSFEIDDNPNEDPDWRKTPLAKRLRKLQKSPSDSTKNALKRSSDGGCTCKGSCGARNCGCRRFERNCSSKCKCSTSNCVNRTITSEKELDDETISSEDEDYKKSRMLLPVSISTRTRRKRRGFFHFQI